jgi:hypothetical protein
MAVTEFFLLCSETVKDRLIQNPVDPQTLEAFSKATDILETHSSHLSIWKTVQRMAADRMLSVPGSIRRIIVCTIQLLQITPQLTYEILHHSVVPGTLPENFALRTAEQIPYMMSNSYLVNPTLFHDIEPSVCPPYSWCKAYAVGAFCYGPPLLTDFQIIYNLPT